MKIDIIMPVLNESSGIRSALESLQNLRENGHSITVVDGGSSDGTLEACGSLADRLKTTAAGRGRQMNTGAGEADGQVLLFLHADTHLPPDVQAEIARFLRSNLSWGRFDVRLDGDDRAFRVIERMINWRSRLTGIATGDQAMFVRRDVFEDLGGFAEIALMEDVELSRRLRARSRPFCIASPVVTSSRRWRANGTFRTILLMWRLRWDYWRGVPPDQLVRRYYPQIPERRNASE